MTCIDLYSLSASICTDSYNLHNHLLVVINANKLPLYLKKMWANLLFLIPPDVQPLEFSELCFPYVWNAYGF